MATHRSAGPSVIDAETAAIRDLVARMRGLRRRVALPFVAAAVIPGHLGILLHVTGHWSVLGVLPDGTYLVHPVTILLAFAILACPFVAMGVPVYLFLRAQLRRSWREQHLRQHGLADHWLDATTRRFG
jgi:hypothetical protein